MKATVTVRCPFGLKVELPSKCPDEAKYTVLNEHNHPTGELDGYPNSSATTGDNVQNRSTPEYLALPVHPELLRASQRLLEGGWNPTEICSKLMVSAVRCLTCYRN
eukprot:gb/GECG01000009.1/.p1 GENE.gb/GECG01000009.1/~~gb/GECG01000009.1/.p1  ORF type:complete len:106 (+),score=9.74 gb/GECG01000009.1/:1-318(+)